MADETPISRILSYYEALGTREREALAVIAERLCMGQAQYGPLTHKKKNWAKEGFEECCDLAVYMAAKLLDIADEENGEPRT